MKKFIKALASFAFMAAIVVFCAIIYFEKTIPAQFNVTAGKTLRLNRAVVASDTVDIGKEAAVYASNGVSSETTLRLFGLFPIKKVNVSVVEQPVVMVAGIPFGIKMYTDGVLVVGFSDVDTAAGPCNPAKIAGLKTGDVILSVNDTEVSSNSQIKKLIENSNGEIMKFKVRRNNLHFSIQFKAVKSLTENRFKSGFWVRDSSAGIGTLTFFDMENNTFGGLGHAVCDVDTNEKLPISTGEIVTAEITGVKMGKAGNAGSLDGTLHENTIGLLSVNSETGVYGMLTHFPTDRFETLPVAMKQQIQTGPAEILTTIDGNTPQKYTVEITHIRFNDASPTKNMTIRITDERLLSVTGGIVQGMSGSPIIQNGKLIGAVTHVLVDDPTKGYGIFAENMLETAQSVAECNKLKDAS